MRLYQWGMLFFLELVLWIKMRVCGKTYGFAY
jgi:hypothetical protein